MPRALFLTTLAWVFLLGSTANAEPPNKVIPYSGVIELNGVPISDALAFNFALFTCNDPDNSCPTPVWVASGSWGSGAASWREGWPVDGTPVQVSVYSGRFSVDLGRPDMAPIPANFFLEQHQYYLAMQVEGVALVGLKRLGYSAAAIRAYQAQDFLVRGDLDVQGQANIAGPLSAGPITTSGDIRISADNGQVAISNNFALIDSGDSWLRLRSAFSGTNYADLAIKKLSASGNVNVGGDFDVHGTVARSGCYWKSIVYTHISQPTYSCGAGEFVVGIKTKFNSTYVDVYPGGIQCCKIGN